MPLQYISDVAGNHTAVIIPIQEWNTITKTHEDLKQLEVTRFDTQKKPSDFACSLSEEGYRVLQEHTQKVRAEWDRNSY